MPSPEQPHSQPAARGAIGLPDISQTAARRQKPEQSAGSQTSARQQPEGSSQKAAARAARAARAAASAAKQTI